VVIRMRYGWDRKGALKGGGAKADLFDGCGAEQELFFSGYKYFRNILENFPAGQPLDPGQLRNDFGKTPDPGKL